jgi:flagellar basal-body rod protein FlgC
MHEPGHPHADERGFVAYANVDSLSEMVTIMNATRAYEANISGMSATRAMALKALEIGGQR